MIFFSNELPKEFIDDYDVGEVILETRGHHETAKEFDKVLNFTELIQKKHPKLYKEYFQYFDDFLIDYYSFYNKPDKAKKSFSNFLMSPLQDFDQFIISFKKLLFYQHIDVLDKAITKNYNFIFDSDELIGSAGYDLATCKYYITLEEFHQKYEKDKGFDKNTFCDTLVNYGFDFEESSISAIEKGICQPIIDNEKLISIFKHDMKNFEIILQGYFLKYMQRRNFHFVLSGMLWDKLLEFWEENSNKKQQKPDDYFLLQPEKYEQYLSRFSGFMLLDNKSEMIAMLWGSVYIYDFLKSINIIKEKL